MGFTTPKSPKAPPVWVTTTLLMFGLVGVTDSLWKSKSPEPVTSWVVPLFRFSRAGEAVTSMLTLKVGIVSTSVSSKVTAYLSRLKHVVVASYSFWTSCSFATSCSLRDRPCASMP